MATFLLTILGTFMTRSGVFNSVHSFTQSSIGPTLLIFLGAATILSIVLLALRIDSLEAEGRLEGAATREGMFLVNNLLFVLLTFTVLNGTVFPLIVEAVNGKQMSVGRPYFDSMVVPVGAALLFLIGIGPALPWGRTTRQQLVKSLVPPLFTGAIAGIAGYALGVHNAWTFLTLLFGGYAAHVTLLQLWKGGGKSLTRGRRRFGSYLIHAGAVIVLVAIAVSSTMKTQHEARLGRGESAQIGAYTVTFLGAEDRTEPHRQSTVAKFQVTKNGRTVATMEPRMNQYARMREPIGTPDVYSTIGGDLYLSLMNLEAGTDHVAVLMIQTPMVGWIWFAVLLMGLGGVVALVPTRQVLSAAKDPLPENPELSLAGGPSLRSGRV
jgi:cytochrome c-type biogenesis protein CcmF